VSPPTCELTAPSGISWIVHEEAYEVKSAALSMNRVAMITGRRFMMNFFI
jgi:hypothetical protein